MNKKLFNSLTIIEQINYFNERLKHGLNITQVCSEINISYNTIRDRFSKNFYSYNKLNNRYECVEKIFPLDEEAIERALEKIVIKIFNSPQDNPNTNNKLLIEPKEDKIVHRSFRIYLFLLYKCYKGEAYIKQEEICEAIGLSYKTRGVVTDCVEALIKGGFIKVRNDFNVHTRVNKNGDKVEHIIPNYYYSLCDDYLLEAK